MPPQKPLRDWVYLALIANMLLGMFTIDLVALLPPSLWRTPLSPLHFLARLRARYVAFSADPFASAEHPPWFRLLLYVEAGVQLPLAVYLVRRLASRRPSSGPAELAALVFGCITALGTAICCFDLWHMGPDDVSPRRKAVLLGAVYLPFAVIPTTMAVDMYLRLLSRVRDAETHAEARTKAKRQ